MPKVSIIIPTFNHSKFISKTIEGCLMQQTNFDFELLIGDDASTDDNALIIRQFQEKFPDKIRAFLHKQNLGPAEPKELGGKNNVAFLFKEAKSEYIALCEGDDYWTDPQKLQKQIDFLDENPDFSLTHHQLEVIYEDNSPCHNFNDENQSEISTIEDLLKDEKWILGTASTVFRNHINGNFPDWWMKSASGDLGIFILTTIHGNIKYFNEKMGVYRKHRGGMTNIHTPQNIIFLRNRMHMFEAINEYYNFRYEQILNKTIKNFQTKIQKIDSETQNLSTNIRKSNWFETWFNTPFYHKLYKSRNDTEAKNFIDNLENTLKFNKKYKILDLACGKGRHSIYLNSKGYEVVGLDLSENNIQKATESANENLHFFVHDMREVFQENEFDLVINLFTSFGYFEDEADNLKTVQAIEKSLKKSGILILDYMNSTKAIKNLVKFYEKEVEGIRFRITKDLQNGFILKNIDFEFEDKKYHFQERVKALEFSNFQQYFQQANLKLLHTFGNYQLDDFEIEKSDRMIFIVEKGE